MKLYNSTIAKQILAETRATLNGNELPMLVKIAEGAFADAERLREGLEFYANGWHYRKTDDGDFEIDTGEHARKYLSNEELSAEISRAKENEILRTLLDRADAIVGFVRRMGHDEKGSGELSELVRWFLAARETIV